MGPEYTDLYKCSMRKNLFTILRKNQNPRRKNAENFSAMKYNTKDCELPLNNVIEIACKIIKKEIN